LKGTKTAENESGDPRAGEDLLSESWLVGEYVLVLGFVSLDASLPL
jgi:hypothetical protein